MDGDSTRFHRSIGGKQIRLKKLRSNRSRCDNNTGNRATKSENVRNIERPRTPSCLGNRLAKFVN